MNELISRMLYLIEYDKRQMLKAKSDSGMRGLSAYKARIARTKEILKIARSIRASQ